MPAYRPRRELHRRHPDGPWITQADLATTLAGLPDIDETPASHHRPRIDTGCRGVRQRTRGSRALRAIEPHMGDWLRFGRLRLTAADVRTAAAAGPRVSRPHRHHSARAGGFRPRPERRWHARTAWRSVRAAVGEERFSTAPWQLWRGDVASRAAAREDAVRAADALLALQQLATAPGGGRAVAPIRARCRSRRGSTG